jgi:transcriptional regulator with XRE-family HTH domain
MAGPLVRALRLACGLDQGPLADALGFSQAHLSKLERSDNRLSAERWLAAASALGLGTREEDEGTLQYVLAHMEEAVEDTRVLRLLYDEDGEVPMFVDATSALTAFGVLDEFREFDPPNACLLAIWPDFAERIAADGEGTVEVSASGESEQERSLALAGAVLAAASSLVRTWFDRAETRMHLYEIADLESSEVATSSGIHNFGRPDPSALTGPLVVIGQSGELLWPPSQETQEERDD